MKRAFSASLLFPLVFLLAGAAHAQTASFKHPDGTTHWYEVVATPGGIGWQAANAAAASRGGYLVTITSQEENAFVFNLADQAALWSRSSASSPWEGPWLGGVQDLASSEPSGGWRWAELDAFSYQNWASGKPDNAGNADRIHFFGSISARQGGWADAPFNTKLLGYIVEFSEGLVPVTVGIRQRLGGSLDGYTLIDPWRTGTVFLVDYRGRPVHSWFSQNPPGMSAYLEPNGHLLRCGRVGNPRFTAGGNGGIVEEFDWNGNLLWSFRHSSDDYCLHHDIERLPNGNILMLAWERRSYRESVAAGRNENELIDGELWPEKIIEVKPNPNGGGDIVWEWRVWDHLIQDYDPTKANYGPVDKHPELIDLNYIGIDGRADWLHANSIHYNAKLDQIVVSMRSFDEIWIIDHSTTTAEAASHSGGRSGKGGDLLYRWGNPLTYRAGKLADRQLFKQHDAHWIPDGLSGAGRIMIFNNGAGRQPIEYSSVDEIVPPTPDAKGNYPLTGAAYGPTQPIWTYASAPLGSFFASFVSGAQRLPNGGTLICGGNYGLAFEINSQGKEVWEYINPIQVSGIAQQGDVPVGNVIFRAPRYAPDYPGLQGKVLVPGDALEKYGTALLVDGSTLPRRTTLNSTVQLLVQSPNDAGKVFQLGTSMTSGLIPIDDRFVKIGVDPLLLASMTSQYFTIFQRYSGILDANGRARAQFSIPNNSALINSLFYTSCIIKDPQHRSGIGTILNTVLIGITL